MPLSHQDERLKLRIEGYITNVNYSHKRATLLLFINHRLVDSLCEYLLQSYILHVFFTQRNNYFLSSMSQYRLSGPLPTLSGYLRFNSCFVIRRQYGNFIECLATLVRSENVSSARCSKGLSQLLVIFQQFK